MALVGAFLDTSVLLPGLVEIGPGGVAAQRLLAAVAGRRLRDPLTAWHCCLEFYAVATRLPEELRLSPQDAARLVEGEILGRFHVHQLPWLRRTDFWSAAVRDRVAGGRIYDAHIADVAASAGARVVVTDNPRHFSGLRGRGLRVLSSLEAAEEL